MYHSIERLIDSLRDLAELAQKETSLLLKLLILLAARDGVLRRYLVEGRRELFAARLRDLLTFYRVKRDTIDNILDKLAGLTQRISKSKMRVVKVSGIDFHPIVTLESERGTKSYLTAGFEVVLSSEKLARMLEKALTFYVKVPSSPVSLGTGKLSTCYREGEKIYVPALLSDIVLGILHLLGVKNADRGLRKVLHVFERERRQEIAPHPRLPKLRPYQEEALEYWWRRGGRGIVVLPVGAGKTNVALEAALKIRKPLLVLVDTDALRSLWRNRISHLLGIQVVSSIEAASAACSPALVLTVRSLSSAIARAVESGDEEEKRKVLRILMRPLLIIDEAHHVAAPEHLAVVLSMNPLYIMGLTATPDREDHNEFPAYMFLGSICYARTYIDLCRQGYLAPVQIISLSDTAKELASLAIANLHRLRSWTELSQSARKLVAEVTSLLNEYFREGKVRMLLEKMYSPAEEPSERSRASNMLRELLDLLHSLAVLDKIVEEAREGRKIIIFFDRLEPLHILEDILTSAGIEVAVITGSRKELEKTHREDVRIVLASQAGEEGVDIPTLDTEVMAALTATRRVAIQRLGRISRASSPDKIARLYIVYATDIPPDAEAGTKVLSILRDYLDYGEMKKIIEERLKTKYESILRKTGMVLSQDVERMLRYLEGKLGVTWMRKWFWNIATRISPREATDFDILLAVLLRMLIERETMGSIWRVGYWLRHCESKEEAPTVASWIVNPRRYRLLSPERSAELYEELRRRLRKTTIETLIKSLLTSPDALRRLLEAAEVERNKKIRDSVAT